MIVSLALVLSCFSFRSSGPYHRVDVKTPHALNLCEWTRTQQNIGQRHAGGTSGTKESEKRKETYGLAGCCGDGGDEYNCLENLHDWLQMSSFYLSRRWLENL